MMKRTFDILVSAAGLVLLSPVLLVVALLIKADSAGPVFFLQERMGRRFRPFHIYKFRTMVPDAPRLGKLITVGEDPRITRVGRILRLTKIDELPQLLNVLKGDMSLVGPRPEVRHYVELFRPDYEEILQVPPGITDLASVHYRHESEILGRAENPEEQYIKEILPEKIRLAKEYLRQSSFCFDAGLIVQTLVVLVKK
jgi:lipopolysaccharide/colanic/teichoic acid biosynthesis glycosyltransferase